MTTTTLVLIAAYLLGSIPFAYLLARRLGGVDIRTIGSRNVGAANVLRATRPVTAAMVTLLDMGKGAAAVWSGSLAGGSLELCVAAGLAAIVGHVYPVWLGFRGGKGVATAAGAFAMLAPRAAGVAFAVFVLAVWRTGYVSIGSLAGALVLPVATWIGGMSRPVVAGAAAASAFIVFKHRANLRRLRAGNERRLGQRT